MLLLSLRLISASGTASHRQQIRETLPVIGNLTVKTKIIELLVILDISGESVSDKWFLLFLVRARSTLSPAPDAVFLD